MRPILLTLLLLTATAHATVQSDTVFFVKPDGRHYLVERSIHSGSPTHRFHLDKQVRLQDILHISPARYDWDTKSSDQLNSLTFNSGGFSVIYPGEFNATELQRDADGNYQYNSWNGQRDVDGHYGYWYSPGEFDQFSYTWILPDNAELLRYRSNRHGKWTRRGKAISFYAEMVNDLTFEISYRIEPATSQESCPPAPQQKKCPTTPPPTPKALPVATAANRSPGTDRDGDKVADSDDLCPNTPRGAKVDRVGCPLDADHDKVPDGIDRCIATPDDTPVDTGGCAASPTRTQAHKPQ